MCCLFVLYWQRAHAVCKTIRMTFHRMSLSDEPNAFEVSNDDDDEYCISTIEINIQRRSLAETKYLHCNRINNLWEF